MLTLLLMIIAQAAEKWLRKGHTHIELPIHKHVKFSTTATLKSKS